MARWRDFYASKSTVTELNPQTEAAWRDFEKATKSSEPALIGVQKVSKMLGISKDALPAISDAGILSSIEIEGQKVERKFLLKQVVCMRSDLCSLEKMRKIEAGWVRKKNNSKPRKRDAAAGPEAPATLGA